MSYQNRKLDIQFEKNWLKQKLTIVFDFFPFFSGYQIISKLHSS